MTTAAAEPQPVGPYQVAREAIAELATPEGFVLGDVIAQTVLDSGVVIPAGPSGQYLSIVVPEGVDAQKVLDQVSDLVNEQLASAE